MNKLIIVIIAMLCFVSFGFKIRNRQNDFGIGKMLDTFQETATGMLDTATQTVTDTNEAVSNTAGDTVDAAVDTANNATATVTETLGGEA